MRDTQLPGVEAVLDTLIDQVQTALLGNPAFYQPTGTGARLIRNVSNVTVDAGIKADGASHLGGATVSFDLAYQDAYPTLATTDLSQIAITIDPVPTPPAPIVPDTVPVLVSITSTPS